MPASFAQVVLDATFSTFGKSGVEFRLFCPLTGMEIATAASDERETIRRQSPHLRFLIDQAGGTWAPRIEDLPADHRGYMLSIREVLDRFQELNHGAAVAACSAFLPESGLVLVVKSPVRDGCYDQEFLSFGFDFSTACVGRLPLDLEQVSY